MPACRNCGKQLAKDAALCTGCGVIPPKGDKFCYDCGAQTDPAAEICVKCGARLREATAASSVSPKSRTATSLLAFFLGQLGIHRFYLGKIKTGILMLVTLGGLGIWALIDFIIAVSGHMKDKNGLPIKTW